MNKRRVLTAKCVLSFLLSTAVVLGLAGLLAQSTYADANGRIRGIVVDAQGAAVSAATIKIVNSDTSYERTLTSSDVGSFDAPDLAPGTYSVTVTKDGFRTFRQTAIKVEATATYAFTATLEVGEMSATIEVVAEKLQADTTTMQLGGDLAGADLKDFPLLNRAWINLQTSLPGVVASSDRFSTNFSTNGSRTQSNNYLVNGTDSNDLPLNTPIANAINPDAIAEVKVVDSTLNPEYGRNSGATLMVTTKSGSNVLHGSAFEFYRDTFMNAKNFFSTTVPPFHQNQFGGSVGGPIIKNKLFFFFAYQGTRAFSGVADNTPVFSDAQRNGDLSGSNDTLSASTGASPFPLFGDAASPCPVGGAQCPAGTTYSTLFSTGVIPTQDINPISAKLLTNFVPHSNAPNNFFEFSNNTLTSPDQYIGKLDFNVSSKDTIGFYLFWTKSATTATLPFTGATLPGTPETDTSKIYQYTVNETHVFNQQWVNEIRFGYNRFNFNAVQPTNPVAPSSLGFTGINPQNTTGQSVPFVGVTSYFSLGFSTNGPQPRIDDTGELIDSISYVTGKHAFKWGIDFRRGHVSNPFNFLNNGSFSFAGNGSFTTGDTAADFLLGIPDGYNQSSGNFIDARSWEFYSFIQDQWKIKPNLTFTYGIGWQVDTPLTDHFNNGLAINSFNVGQQSTVFPTAPTGLLFPGDQGVSASGYSTHLNNFAPRLGIAWHPISKLTIRAGFGMYYDNSEEELTLQNLLAPPFALIDAGIGDNGGSPSFAAPFTDIAGRPVGTGGTATLTNKYPFVAPAAGSSVDFSFFEPMGINVVDHRFNTPYVMNRQLTVQYQFTPTILGTFSYVGSAGKRLEGVVEQVPYNEAACLASLTGPFGLGPCTVNRTLEPFYALTNPAISAFSEAPASTFASVGLQCTCLHSSYNSFQATVEKSLSHGLNLRAAYTYAHSLDNASSFENAQGSVIPGNFGATYGNSSFDARQRLVVQYLYQIPDWGFHHLPSKLTKGWTLAGITSFQGGFPVALSESDARTLQCSPSFTFYGCWDRPNIVGPIKLEAPRTVQTLLGSTGVNRKGNFFFDPSSFAREGCSAPTELLANCGWGLGNAGRNLFHGPGIDDTDISFYKDTLITERYTLQLRVDLFNAFNQAQFSNPSGNVASSLFGQITTTRIPARITQLSASFNF
ncbi:MAG: TonB-dependent receptor [Candidatus Acidiferrum sp.]